MRGDKFTRKSYAVLLYILYFILMNSWFIGTVYMYCLVVGKDFF